MTDRFFKDGTIMRNGVKYGCHADLSYDDAPDGCVIYEGRHSDCIFAKLPTGRLRKSPFTCKEWRPVKAGKR